MAKIKEAPRIHFATTLKSGRNSVSGLPSLNRRNVLNAVNVMDRHSVPLGPSIANGWRVSACSCDRPEERLSVVIQHTTFGDH